MHTYIVKLHTCLGLSRDNPHYTYITNPPGGNVYKIHEEYIHAHARATSCHSSQYFMLTLLGIIIPKGVNSLIIKRSVLIGRSIHGGLPSFPLEVALQDMIYKTARNSNTSGKPKSKMAT